MVPMTSAPIVAQASQKSGNYVTYVKNYANNSIQEAYTANGVKHKSSWTSSNSANYKSMSNAYHYFLQNALNSYPKDSRDSASRIVKETASEQGFVSVTLVNKGYSITTIDKTQNHGYVIRSNGEIHQRFRCWH